MPKLVTVVSVFVIAIFTMASIGEAGSLTQTSGPLSPLNVNKTTASSTVNLTTSESISLSTRAPILHLELDGGRRFAIGTLTSPTVSANTSSSTLAYSLTFSGIPTYYKGNGKFVIEAEKPGGAREEFKSAEFPVFIDQDPPRVTSVRAVEDAFGARYVVVSIQDNLLKANYPISHFSVTKTNDNRNLVAQDSTPIAAIGGDFRLTLNDSMVGAFKVSIGKSSNNEDFSDAAGNPLDPATFVISASGQRVTGPAVEFPPNVVAPKAPGHSDTNEIRPSSRVVTRVVRLYYYRNADHVAEIINRRTQQYNLAQANARKSLAEQLGEKAEDATSERRNSERLAEQAAQKTREAEKELQNLQMDAEEAKVLLRNLSGYPNDYKMFSDAQGNLRVISQTEATSNNIGSLMTVEDFRKQLTDVQKKFDEQQAKVADLRATEFEANNKAKRNEDLESRLIRSQFLKEVEAAETDPATYAPGDINSVDPVMQTSVSVIGEGVLQLRGPIGGINQIRRMIHQIDMPVGQVKVDIETVQINGEKGPELEKSVQLVEGYINVGRFLTNQSLVFLCRSVTEIAAEVAQEHGEPWQRDQSGRDMRYLYGFFGQDFIDTLHRMDSEFLHSENQILSLHSMDAISRNRALLLIGLAKNSVRQRILERFQQYVSCTLPQMEYQYRTINQAIPCKYLPECCEECKESLLKVIHIGHKVEVIRYTPEMACEDAAKNYQFLNFYNFFAQGIWHDASLNPVQREFIRLAQVFKSQLISEIELKQRIVERGLMDQKSSEDKVADQESLLELRKKAVKQKNDLLLKNTEATSQVANTVVLAMSNMEQIRSNLNNYREQYQQILSILDKAERENKPLENQEMDDAVQSIERIFEVAKQIDSYLVRSKESIDLLNRIRAQLTSDSSLARIANVLRSSKARPDSASLSLMALKNDQTVKANLDNLQRDIQMFIESITHTNRYVERQYDQVLRELETFKKDWKPVFQVMQDLEPFIPVSSEQWRQRHQQATAAIREMIVGQIALKATQDFLDQNRLSLPQLKLLDHLIDEHEEKSMNLLEGTRSHISAIDNFLKRMTYALEDDFQIQFYDPALVCMRAASRQRRVTFSQVERTTVLGNNRSLLKVLPQATMEFDLPNRKLRVTEAMQGAKALVDDYGALLNDPTFLAAFQMMGGGAPAESIRNIVPSLPSESSQKYHALPASQSGDRLGASLQGLVPDPEIYQIETGTGFEVRPVIQPDGDSMVYDLNYLYHTEMREPVRADEKHLGRIKRHLIHTQVQTSSFELREVGRYQVALKVSRTAKGVPMLENAPVVGALFRPAPSTESSIQQNILLAKSVIYPTLYDLMGLSWAQHVAELNYDSIRNAGHVSRGRQEMIRSHVFDESSRNVDDFLQIKEDAANHRPDLYREYTMPSPYHPNGYVYPKVRDEQDPTRRGFRVPEIRPEAYRAGSENGVPAQDFDNRFRLPIPQDSNSGMIEELPPGTGIPVPSRSNSSMIRTPSVRENMEPYTGSARQRPTGQGSPTGFNAPSVRTPNGSPAVGGTPTGAQPAAPLQLNSINQRQTTNVGAQQAVVPASATVVLNHSQTTVRQPSLNARPISGVRPAGSPAPGSSSSTNAAPIQPRQIQGGNNQPAPLPPAGSMPVVPASYQFESLPPPPGQW